MFKIKMSYISIIFICISRAQLSSLEPLKFEYECYFANWGTLGTIYRCNVKNSVNITTPEEAEVQNVTGTHQNGYNNDNVVAFSVNNKGQIHYFPRGLNKFFKNLQGIQIANTGLKEVHKADLKDFPELVNLHMWSGDLEILEENLFRFNPKLNFITFGGNKISHIDPLAFDGLAKLKSLSLWNNSCIDLGTSKNLTAVQIILKVAKVQCSNPDYSNLDRKFKNLKNESKTLNSETLRKRLENWENEFKSSKFYNFFQQNLQELKAVQVRRVKQEELMDTISTFKDIIKFDTCLQLEVKLATIEGQIQENQRKNAENFKNIKDKGTDTSNATKDNLVKILEFIEKLDKKITVIEDKLAGIDNTQKKLMNKIHKIETDSHDCWKSIKC